MRWAENDELFLNELCEGHKWEQAVGAALRMSGLQCEVSPLQFRDGIENIGRFADTPDIICCGQRLEVKSRRLSFDERPESYPYSTAFVDTVDGWDQKEHQPVAVVLISQNTGSMLVVSSKTRASWTIRNVRDRVREINVRNYECPRTQLLSYDTLVSWLKEKR